MAKKIKMKTAKKSAKAAVHKKPKKNPVKKRTTLKKTVKKSKTNKTSVKKKITAKVHAKKAPSKKAITLHVEHKKITSKVPAVHAKKSAPAIEEISAAEIRARAIKKIKGYSKKDLESSKALFLKNAMRLLNSFKILKNKCSILQPVNISMRTRLILCIWQSRERMQWKEKKLFFMHREKINSWVILKMH